MGSNNTSSKSIIHKSNHELQRCIITHVYVYKVLIPQHFQRNKYTRFSQHLQSAQIFIISYKYSLIVNTTFLMHPAKPTTLCSEKVINQNLTIMKISIHTNHHCKIWSNALINSINLENTNISKYSINLHAIQFTLNIQLF